MHVAFKRMVPAVFEKDDDDNGHIDFITAASVLINTFLFACSFSPFVGTLFFKCRFMAVCHLCSVSYNSCSFSVETVDLMLQSLNQPGLVVMV